MKSHVFSLGAILIALFLCANDVFAQTSIPLLDRATAEMNRLGAMESLGTYGMPEIPSEDHSRAIAGAATGAGLMLAIGNAGGNDHRRDRYGYYNYNYGNDSSTWMNLGLTLLGSGSGYLFGRHFDERAAREGHLDCVTDQGFDHLRGVVLQDAERCRGTKRKDYPHPTNIRSYGAEGPPTSYRPMGTFDDQQTDVSTDPASRLSEEERRAVEIHREVNDLRRSGLSDEELQIILERREAARHGSVGSPTNPRGLGIVDVRDPLPDELDTEARQNGLHASIAEEERSRALAAMDATAAWQREEATRTGR